MGRPLWPPCLGLDSLSKIGALPKARQTGLICRDKSVKRGRWATSGRGEKR